MTRGYPSFPLFSLSLPFSVSSYLCLFLPFSFSFFFSFSLTLSHSSSLFLSHPPSPPILPLPRLGWLAAGVGAGPARVVAPLGLTDGTLIWLTGASWAGGADPRSRAYGLFYRVEGQREMKDENGWR